MPQFILVELPSFRLKTLSGQPVALAPKYVGLFSSLYQYVRAGLVIPPTSSSAYAYSPGLSASASSSSSSAAAAAAASPPEIAASLLFAGGEPDLWTSSTGTHTSGSGGLHPEEALLLSYFQSFDLPGSYPIVDALLLGSKPCSSCMGYFTSQQGKTLRDPSSGGGSSSRRSGGASSSSSRRSAGGGGGGGGGTSFRARFTPRSDRSYTPIFYLARSLDAAGRAGLWFEMTSMWGSAFLPDPAAAPSSLDLGGLVGGEFGVDATGGGGGGGGMLGRGQMYWLVPGSAWFAVHEQETMTDAEVAEAVTQQGGLLGYWVGR